MPINPEDMRVKAKVWRSLFDRYPGYNDPALIAMLNDAANEIERLRDRVRQFEKARDEADHLAALGDQD